MNSKVIKFKPRTFLASVLFLQAAFYITVLFNVPVVREIVGFIYLTFVPGFIIAKLLKLDKLDGLETILFSIGLSIAFLMIAGLLVNQLSIFGFSRPLTFLPLMLVVNIAILIGAVLVYLRSENVKIWKSEHVEKFPFIFLFLCLPILTIAGAMYANVYGNPLLLMFMIIITSILFVVTVLSKKLLTPKFIPFAVIMIAIALLYHASLISNHIQPFGSDSALEYFIFKSTENNAYWNSALFTDLRYGRVNDLLSITILPTIYSSILNIDSIWLFKLLIPLIFSFVPLGLYQIWQGYIGKKYAFISSFLFMAQSTFYTEMLGLNRQMIAELFFVLLILVIVNKKISKTAKLLSFMIFGFALVVSHYALAEIFLFFIFLSVLFFIIRNRPIQEISLSMVIFFVVMMFTWYIYTSNSTVFESFTSFGSNVIGQLGDFFNLGSRGQTVLIGLGLESATTIWNTISRAFAYVTQLLIGIGFIGLITKRVKIALDRVYLSFSLFAMLFLTLIILVPGLANTFNMTRFYHILLFFLSPFFVIGAVFTVKLLSKRDNKLVISVLLLIVLVPYFLFQTGCVYELTGSDTYSIPLSKYRIDAKQLFATQRYIDSYSAYGAQWFSNNVNFKRVQVYADGNTAFSSLSVYGLIHFNYIEELTNATIVSKNGVVFLSTVNVIHDVVAYRAVSWNTSELSIAFEDLNTVYNNGGSIVYKNSE